MTHTPVTLLSVWLDGAEYRRVGRLALRDRRILFEYDADFIAGGVAISPFELPLRPGVQEARRGLFEGLFGVFADSLPDGWGRLLLDRAVAKHGIEPGYLGPLDRLAYAGYQGMGALSYEPDRSAELAGPETEEPRISLDRIAHESRIVLAGEDEAVFDELLLLSGSSGGARPKIVAQVSDDFKRVIHGIGGLAPGYSPWIIKFASSQDTKESGAIEYAYSLMARAAGVDMPPAHLFRTRRGAYFGVRRFDRNGARRIHMHSLAGLIHADYRHPSLDYDTFLQTTFLLTRSMLDVERAFAMACFNVLAHNRDDHARNFSFLLKDDRKWTLAPAYDLTFSHGPNGEQSMLLLGEGRAPDAKGLLALGKKQGIRKARIILETVQAAVKRWPKFAAKAGVTKRTTARIGAVIAK